MFDILFGWSKASKCKRAIKRARCRLKLLKNKREAIARQLRKDVAELIQSGHEETALNRVEQLIEDESLVAAYDLLDHYCEFILTQFSYIRRHKDCPNDINEAASSLIFASARCGELHELCVIRKLFGERYGEKFATTAVELLPGNLVNKQLKENLSGKPVSDDLKYRLVDEIVRDNCPQQQVLAIQYYPNWQQEQVKENKGYQLVDNGAQINDTTTGSKVHPSEVEEIKRDVTCVNSSISKLSDSCPSPKSTLIDVSAIVSTVQQFPPYILSCPLQKKVVNFPELLPYTTSGLQNKVERMALPSSAERVSSPPHPEEMVDYDDDIEECQFSVSKNGACQDQMLFKFRPSGLSRRENQKPQFGWDENDTDQGLSRRENQKPQFGWDENDTDQDESSSEKPSIRTTRKSKRAPEKRSRRRSASLESLGIMDIGYMTYYHKPCRSPSVHKQGSHYRRKHRKPSLEGIFQSSYSQKRLKQQSFSEKEKILQSCQSEDSIRRKSFNIKMSGCSLDQPCYFCLYDGKDLEALSVKPKRRIKATHIHQVLFDECCHCRPLRDDELNQGKEVVTITQRPNRKRYSGVTEHHVFNYSYCQADNGNKNNEIEAEASVSMGSYASPNVSNPRTTGSLTRMETEAPYSRAMTMPQERHSNSKDKMLRTYSCPPQHPNHVHPKLPDYDDIAAKFTALKRECLENKDCSRDQQGK